VSPLELVRGIVFGVSSSLLKTAVDSDRRCRGHSRSTFISPLPVSFAFASQYIAAMPVQALRPFIARTPLLKGRPSLGDIGASDKLGEVYAS